MTGCVSGEQSTTRTTIGTTVPVLIATTTLDLEAEPTAAEDVDDATEKYFQDMFAQEHISLEDDQKLADAPSCSSDADDLTGVPSTCFKAIYPAFCDAVGEDASSPPLSKKLTSDDMATGGKRSATLLDAFPGRRRTPPPSETACNGWTFEFDWSGPRAGGDCRKSCSDAMESLAASCAPPGPAGIFRSGSVPVGCGTYKYSIAGEGEKETPPPPAKPTSTSTSTSAVSPPTPSGTTLAVTKPTAPVMCYTKKEGCKYWDVPPSEAHGKTDTFCDDHGSMEAFGGPGWPAVQDASNDFLKGASYNFKVLWKPGCVAEGHDTLSLGQPLPDFSCRDAMRMTFDQCNNGGRGGRVEVGCLEYYFNAINQPCPIVGYCNDAPFGGTPSVC